MQVHRFDFLYLPLYSLIYYHKVTIVMKKILFSIAAITSIFAACSPQYSIKGTVAGDQTTGNALLLKSKGRVADTLAKAPITNGKFTLTGKIDTITDAYIAIEGKRMGLPIILENAEYSAVIDFTNPVENKVEGPANQTIFNQVIALANEARTAQMPLYKEFGEAQKANDTTKMKQIEAQFDQIVKDAAEKENALIKANADSYVAAYLLARKMSQLNLKDLEKLFAELGPNAQATEPGQKIAKKIKVLQSVAIGQVAPDFTLNTPEGTPLSMHSIPAKVKIIDFWASWCGPCRRENPNVVKIYEEYHPKGLEILGVSLDNNKEAWLKAIEEDKLVWKHVSDLKGWACEPAALYGVSGIPHMVVLDENNVIIAKDLRGEALKAKIAELLK